MQITALKLRDTLEALAPAIPRKSTLPITLHVRLGEGMAVATDLEVQVTLRLREAEGGRPCCSPTGRPWST